MSADAVTIAGLTTERDAALRHVRLVLSVLRALGHEDGPERCYCGAWQVNDPAVLSHSKDCFAARRELLALRQEERA